MLRALRSSAESAVPSHGAERRWYALRSAGRSPSTARAALHFPICRRSVDWGATLSNWNGGASWFLRQFAGRLGAQVFRWTRRWRSTGRAWCCTSTAPSCTRSGSGSRSHVTTWGSGLRETEQILSESVTWAHPGQGTHGMDRARAVHGFLLHGSRFSTRFSIRGMQICEFRGWTRGD